jgi:hypothetical protein
MDILSAILAIKGDGWAFTPWAAYSSIGAGSGFFEYALTMSPVNGFGAANRSGGLITGSDTADVWWAGFALDVSVFDPLTFGIDAVYGHMSEVDLQFNNVTFPAWSGLPASGPGTTPFETSGWYVAATVDYKLDWGSVGAFGWYASGDDDDDAEDGDFGHLPAIGFDSGFGFGTFGYSSMAVPTTVSGGYNALGALSLGTWGLGVQAANWSFVDKLDHTLRFIYYRGTNDADLVRNHLGGRNPVLAFSGQRVYLTDEDQAFEVDFVTSYKIYENLTAFVDLAWIKLDMDEDVWGNDYKEDDAWKAQLILRYSF